MIATPRLDPDVIKQGLWIDFVPLKQVKYEVGVIIPVFKVTSFACISKIQHPPWLNANVSNEKVIVT